MTDKALIDSAIKAMKNSYSPYSEFKVGAALLCENEEIFTGCNIENSSYPAGICAERTAISKAVSEGNLKFKSIAIVGGKNGNIEDFCTPCGICRQVMNEFCNSSFKVIVYNGKEIKSYTLDKLLPHSFGRDNLCE